MLRTPTSEQRKTYQDILKLYDFAEEMIDAIEQNPYPDPELRLKLVEPLIEQIEESTEILAEAYISFIETGEKPGEEGKEKIVDAVRKIYTAIDDYRDNIKKTTFH